MIEIEKPRIERVEASDSYGKFVVEPLGGVSKSGIRTIKYAIFCCMIEICYYFC